MSERDRGGKETTVSEVSPDVTAQHDVEPGDVSFAEEVVTEQEPVDPEVGERDGVDPDPEAVEKALRQAASTSDQDVRTYVRTIRKIPLLSALEEVELSKDIEAGVYANHILSLRHVEPKDFGYMRSTWRKSIYDESKTSRQFKYGSEKDTEAQKFAEEQAAALYDRIPEHLQMDQAELEELVRIGDRARDRMVQANLRMAVYLVKQKVGRGTGFFDLIQEGNIALMHAVKKFDYTRGVKFSTYAVPWIRQAIKRAA